MTERQRERERERPTLFPHGPTGPGGPATSRYFLSWEPATITSPSFLATVAKASPGPRTSLAGVCGREPIIRVLFPCSGGTGFTDGMARSSAWELTLSQLCALPSRSMMLCVVVADRNISQVGFPPFSSEDWMTSGSLALECPLTS